MINAKMTAIANAIREKTGKTDLLGLDDMPGEINSIQSAHTQLEEQWIGMITGTLKDVNIPLEVTNLRAYIFYDYNKIEHITLNHVTKIGAYAFAGCSALSSTSLSEGLEEIGNSAFMNTAFPEIHIPKETKLIDDYAFRNCRKMKKATFMGKPEAIGTHCFAGCSVLKDVYVPWSDGEVVGAPWGATLATIHYNSTGV